MKDKKELLSQKKIKELLHYDPLSGIFTWKERPFSMFSHCKNPQHQCDAWNTVFSGKEAGGKYKPTVSKAFYIRINITLNKKMRSYLAHRLVFLYTEGKFPPEQVDHIDGDGLNNKIINLRKVSHQDNLKNKPMYSNNTSGCVGVIWNKKSQKWHVQIRAKSKNIYGGLYSNIEDAIARRRQMEVEYGFHKNHGRKV